MPWGGSPSPERQMSSGISEMFGDMSAEAEEDQRAMERPVRQEPPAERAEGYRGAREGAAQLETRSRRRVHARPTRSGSPARGCKAGSYLEGRAGTATADATVYPRRVYWTVGSSDEEFGWGVRMGSSDGEVRMGFGWSSHPSEQVGVRMKFV